MQRFHEILYLNTFRKSVEKIQVSLNLKRITGTLHEEEDTFLITSVLLGMRNISGKVYRENQNTLFIFNNFFSKAMPFV